MAFFGSFILRFRIVLLLLMGGVTIIMGYFARKVEISYEFIRAIPTDNSKYRDVQQARGMFGDDGNVIMIALSSPDFFEDSFFHDYGALAEEIGTLPAIQNVLSVPTAMTLVRDTANGQLNPRSSMSSPATPGG